MYTEQRIVASKAEGLNLEIVKRMPHDFTKPYYIIKLNGVERVRNSTAEDVAIALVGMIESMYEHANKPRPY